MAAVGEATIANMALTFLGATPITSLEDEGTEGKIVNIHYEPSRDATLEAREWTFAVKRASLAPRTEPPDWGFGQAFAIPPDTLRILECRDDGANAVFTNVNGQANSLDWRREGGNIVANANVLRVRYLARITDPNSFTPAFVQAFAARLAMDMAIGITQSPKTFADMAGMYAAKVREAAATDGMQGRTQVIRSSRLVGVRGMGSAGGGQYFPPTV